MDAQGEGISREEFDALHRRLRGRVFGYVRLRVDDDADAQDIAQNAWVTVWERRHSFDPRRGTFEAFVKYWASVYLLRHYHARKRRWELESLLSELSARFPGLEEEAELLEVMERLRAPAEEEWMAPDPAAIILAAAAVPLGLRLLHVAFGGASPPHQLIAFGFAKFAGDPEEQTGPTASGRRGGSDPTRARAAKVVASLSDTPLRVLERDLEVLLTEELRYGADDVASALARLRESMGRAFRQVVSDVRTLRTYQHLADAVVGDTTLRDYYTGRPEDCISEWIFSVKRRTWSDVSRDRDLSANLLDYFAGLAGRTLRRRIGKGGHGDGS